MPRVCNTPQAPCLFSIFIQISVGRCAMSVGKWEWVESVGREHAEAEGVAAPHFPAVCGVTHRHGGLLLRVIYLNPPMLRLLRAAPRIEQSHFYPEPARGRRGCSS